MTIPTPTDSHHQAKSAEPAYPPEWDTEGEPCSPWQCTHEDKVCDSANDYWVENHGIDIYRVLLDLFEACTDALPFLGGADPGALARNQVEFWARALGYSPPAPVLSLKQRRGVAQVANRKHQRAVWDRDEWRCVRCGEHRWLTVDHIIPISRGGSDEMDNKQTLCVPCNSAKGTR